ncbi:uncharacterized protein LOC142328366 [Lycorma delicatula]|uniref:uncharacterized protein LOC142328366 n=1 Tax=Lycorma delicatula TaxID=130591 RepID=UPI003F518CFC
MAPYIFLSVVRDVNSPESFARKKNIAHFLSVENQSDETYHVVTKMVECCESITDDDSDCEFIHLLGGNMGYLAPKKARNFSLIFPNMYPHNRRGECKISIWYRGRTNISAEVRHQIIFDTYISRTHAPGILKNYYEPWEYTDCQSPDQDPLDNCLPVNCHMKYSGCRSFFNHLNQRCQRIPVCMSDPKKEMPDVAYVPMSNTCRDLETAITEEDVQYLTRNGIDTKWKVEPPPKITNIRCHHGHIDNTSGICVCDPGWTSTPFDRDQFNPSTVLYHMCTIQEHPHCTKRLFSFVGSHYMTE